MTKISPKIKMRKENIKLKINNNKKNYNSTLKYH